jgi:hypothetical protein
VTGENIATPKSKKQSVDPPKRLVLDLIGPFVVHFTGGMARIHAPLCLDHHANILTDNDDIGLPSLIAPAPQTGYPEGFTYRMAGPTPNAAKCNCPNPERLLIVTMKLGARPATNCHSVMEVPNPNTMVPLLPEPIWINRNGSGAWVNADPGTPDIVNGQRARGLRFIYTDCPAQPNIKLMKQPKSPTPFNPDFTPENSDALGLDPAHYHITLRFQSNGSSPDEHHEDAYNCFQAMRTLIPEASKWRVDFDDSETGILPRHHGGTVPVDCGAAIIVVQE